MQLSFNRGLPSCLPATLFAERDLLWKTKVCTKYWQVLVGMCTFVGIYKNLKHFKYRFSYYGQEMMKAESWGSKAVRKIWLSLISPLRNKSQIDHSRKAFVSEGLLSTRFVYLSITELITDQSVLVTARGIITQFIFHNLELNPWGPTRGQYSQTLQQGQA